MPNHPNAIAPERQRRFDRAFLALAALCPGRERRVSDFKIAHLARIEPPQIERARWLLVAMALSRGTAGGAAMTAILRRGYAVTSEYGRWRQPGGVLPLDTPGLLYLGHVLPGRNVPWKCLEQVALATDAHTVPERRWCSAHETLRVIAQLQEEGHLSIAMVSHLEGDSPSPASSHKC
jgi:hypothetical protein